MARSPRTDDSCAHMRRYQRYSVTVTKGTLRSLFSLSARWCLARMSLSSSTWSVLTAWGG